VLVSTCFREVPRLDLHGMGILLTVLDGQLRVCEEIVAGSRACLRRPGRQA